MPFFTICCYNNIVLMEVLMMMETEIFQKCKVNFKKLLEYGFTYESHLYHYSTVLTNHFRADIVITEDGTLSGAIYDLITGEEYTNFRVKNQTGPFVSSIREEYRNILEKIRISCFTTQYFISNQANRITSLIMQKFDIHPDFPWKISPEFGVFRNKGNKKWFALLMNIDRDKLEKSSTGMIEVINVKVNQNKVSLLLKKKGIFPAYHMNKKNWITIALDDSLSDQEIFSYIEESYDYTE